MASRHLWNIWENEYVHTPCRIHICKDAQRSVDAVMRSWHIWWEFKDFCTSVCPITSVLTLMWHWWTIVPAVRHRDRFHHPHVIISEGSHWAICPSLSPEATGVYKPRTGISQCSSSFSNFKLYLVKYSRSFPLFSVMGGLPTSYCQLSTVYCLCPYFQSWYWTIFIGFLPAIDRRNIFYVNALCPGTTPPSGRSNSPL